MTETTVVAITEEEKSVKILKAEEKVRQAKADLRRAKNEEKKIEVLEYNRKDLNRMLENERSKERSLSLGRGKNNLSL